MTSKSSEMLEYMTLVEERWIKMVYMRKSAKFEERSWDGDETYTACGNKIEGLQ